MATAQLNDGTIIPINGISNASISLHNSTNSTYLYTNGVAGMGNVILQMISAYTASGESATESLIKYK